MVLNKSNVGPTRVTFFVVIFSLISVKTKFCNMTTRQRITKHVKNYSGKLFRRAVAAKYFVCAASTLCYLGVASPTCGSLSSPQTKRCIHVPFQGIRSEDRTFVEGFAPTAEIFYGTRVKVSVAMAMVFSVVRCSCAFIIPVSRLVDRNDSGTSRK